jgi:tRNA A-37 threonylcarbamoyl transferase component Bud32
MAVESRLLGRYELGRVLGSGGMAEVFEGHDQLLDRRVAIKVLHPQYARDPSFVERFKREARAAASLAHPCVVGVYDTGEQNGTHFIVMEFVEGRTLADVLEQGGPLEPRRALRIAVDVCAALTAAHTRGLIHRDVKPGNVMLTPRDQVKVMDFGIVRAGGSATVTEAENVLGTARYMSPEQAQAREVDERSDVYSLGACMYEMLTGQPPFSGTSPIAVAAKHITESPQPLRALRPDLPERVEPVILRALAKDPARRFRTAAELGGALEKVLRRLPADGARPPGQEPPPAFERASAVDLGWPLAGRDAPQRGNGQVARPAPGSYAAPVPEVPSWLGDRRQLTAAAIAFGVIVLLSMAGVALSRSTPVDGGQRPAAAGLPVPYVVRYPEGAARALLQQQGFPVRGPVRREPSDRIQAGSVIDTEPRAGTLARRGQPVLLVVSTGPRGTEVPLVIGQQVRDARRYLESLGFQVVVWPVVSGQPPGTVIEQDPLAGTILQRPDRMVLTVARRDRGGDRLPGPQPAAPTTLLPPPPTTAPPTAPPTTAPPTTAPPTTGPSTTGGGDDGGGPPRIL